MGPKYGLKYIYVDSRYGIVLAHITVEVVSVGQVALESDLQIVVDPGNLVQRKNLGCAESVQQNSCLFVKNY